MIIIECSTDDYGIVMEDISEIKEKAEEIESIFSDCTFNQRRSRNTEETKKRSRYDSPRYV